MNNTIKYSVDTDGIALLVIDLPDKSMNVLTPEMTSDLTACVEKMVADKSVKGAVLTSGKAAFIAGADIKELRNRDAMPDLARRHFAGLLASGPRHPEGLVRGRGPKDLSVGSTERSHSGDQVGTRPGVQGAPAASAFASRACRSRSARWVSRVKP